MTQSIAITFPLYVWIFFASFFVGNILFDFAENLPSWLELTLQAVAVIILLGGISLVFFYGNIQAKLLIIVVALLLGKHTYKETQIKKQHSKTHNH